MGTSWCQLRARSPRSERDRGTGWGVQSGQGRGMGWQPRSHSAGVISRLYGADAILFVFSQSSCSARGRLASSALRVHPMVAPFPATARTTRLARLPGSAPPPTSPKSRTWAQRGKNHDSSPWLKTKMSRNQNPPKRQPLTSSQPRTALRGLGAEAKVRGPGGPGTEGEGARRSGRGAGCRH